MLERTRILGSELIRGLERADEVLASHDNNKQHAWLQQSWEEHLRRAIVHLRNAAAGAADGTMIECSHGVVRALMGLTLMFEDRSVSANLCASHAKQKQEIETEKDSPWFGTYVSVPTYELPESCRKFKK